MTQATMKTAPAPLAPVPFNIPKPFKTTLANGMRVVIFEQARLPLVSFRLAFMSGDSADPSDSIGLMSAVTSMIMEGTENYSSRALAEKIERLGASLSASSSDDFSVVSASTLALYSSEVLALIAEVVFRPTFPESELDLYRRNTIENLKFQRSQPNFLANEQTARLIYGKHPYAHIAPKAADVERLTSESLAAHLAKHFVPNNAVFIAVGDVDRESLVAEIESHFGDWQRGAVTHNLGPEPSLRDVSSLTIVDRPGSAQSNIVLSNLALKRNDPDYFPVLVMNQVLGAGASSRVFMNLREEKGYTYGAYTRLDSKLLAGEFEATAEVRTAVTGDSLKEFFYELNRIRDEDVSEDELADAKNFLTGVFPIRAETQEGLTNLIVAQELYGLPDDYLQTYRSSVSSVTTADVRRVANKYVRPDRTAIVIVGDAGEVIAQASGYAATVEIFDTDGKPKSLEEYTADPGELADFSGKWKLTLDFQGQSVPVSLTLTQNESEVSGELETILGSGKISSGSVRGNKINAAASTEIQGETVDLVINAELTGGEMSGTISAGIIPAPLTFTGSRKA